MCHYHCPASAGYSCGPSTLQRPPFYPCPALKSHNTLSFPYSVLFILPVLFFSTLQPMSADQIFVATDDLRSRFWSPPFVDFGPKRYLSAPNSSFFHISTKLKATPNPIPYIKNVHRPQEPAPQRGPCRFLSPSPGGAQQRQRRECHSHWPICRRGTQDL